MPQEDAFAGIESRAKDASVRSSRALRGARAYHSGRLAESNVKANYLERGFALCEERWRGRGGEIDLIFRAVDAFVFVEVKSSRTHARAAESLSAAQLARICVSAEDYMGRLAGTGSSDFRIDVALADENGRLEILENVSMTSL